MPSFKDQHFLLNFIMGTYLGPDLYSDNPRRSAFHRFAEGLPPYTSNNLGNSFLSISQLESLYYYVLRNAHPSLLLKPDLLYLYFKGKLNFLSSSLPPTDVQMQFTSIFPLNLHEHKRYSASHENVKGVVLVYDPVTSYMKKEDLQRFKCLSGMVDLKIDSKECLTYQHGYRSDAEETNKNCKESKHKQTAGHMCNHKRNSSAMFGKKYKRRNRCDLLLMPAVPSDAPLLKHHKESNSHAADNIPGHAMTAVETMPNLDGCIRNESVTLTGTATKGRAGPPVGVVDIGISKAAYFFQVALPGVRRDFCQVSCEIESNGKVHIQGSTGGGKTIKKRSRVFHMKSQQLCPPGPFTVTFNLPGPVDPRMFSPNFRDDGIFEAVVIKHK